MQGMVWNVNNCKVIASLSPSFLLSSLPPSSLPLVFSFFFSSIKFLGWFCCSCLFLFFEMMTSFVTHTGLEILLILPQLSECCGQRGVSPYLVSSSFFSVQYTEWKPSACLHWIQQEPSCMDSGVFGNVKLVYKMYQRKYFSKQF